MPQRDTIDTVDETVLADFLADLLNEDNCEGWALLGRLLYRNDMQALPKLTKLVNDRVAQRERAVADADDAAAINSNHAADVFNKRHDNWKAGRVAC